MAYSQEDRDFLLGQIHSNVEALLEHRKDHDQRITALERRMWWGLGGLVAFIMAYVPGAKEILFHLGFH